MWSESLRTLEEFEECYREVEVWHEANFKATYEALRRTLVISIPIR